MGASTRKISMSLPISMVDDLDYMASCMGLTRSGLMTVLLSKSVSNITTAMRVHGIDPDSGPEVSRRAVVQSVGQIERELKEMKRALRNTH